MRKPTVSQLRRLVGNPDAYAVQDEDGSWRPVRTPRWAAAGDQVLRDHLAHNATVGTYILHGDKAKTLVFDFDGDDPEQEYDRAVATAEELIRLGFPKRGIGVEFSGRKGYHVWLVFANFVEASKLRRIGRTVLGITGFKCEVFPKQDSAKDLGNLVKLPGGLHQVSKKENNFLDRVPIPLSTQVFEHVYEELPPEPERVRDYDGPDGVLACVDHIAAGVAEGGRNNSLYHYAVLLRGSHRVPEPAVELLVREAAAKCTPPVDDAEVDQILESSREGGPLCDTIPEEFRCDPEECVRKAGGGGLRCRAGQLRYASEGDGVVMKVEERSAGRVRLAHPDMRAGGLVSLEEKK